MSDQASKLLRFFTNASLFQLTSWSYSLICFVDGIVCGHWYLLVAGAVPLAYSALFPGKDKHDQS